MIKNYTIFVWFLIQIQIFLLFKPNMIVLIIFVKFVSQVLLDKLIFSVVIVFNQICS